MGKHIKALFGLLLALWTLVLPGTAFCAAQTTHKGLEVRGALVPARSVLAAGVIAAVILLAAAGTLALLRLNKRHKKYALIEAARKETRHIDDELYALLPVVKQVRGLHSKGRYGFDICPENIAMSRRGAVLRIVRLGLHADGSMIVRRGFTANERYTGGPVGPWTDIYAVSALIYTALMGRLLPHAFERGAALPLFDGLDEKYNALAAVVAQGLSADISERPRSLDMLLNEIEACLEGYSVPSARQARLSRKRVSKKESLERAKGGRKPPSLKRRAVMAFAAALLIFGVTALVCEINYSQAVFYIESGEYAQAKASLGGVFAFYKDAAALESYADAGIRLQNGDYDAALSGFAALGGYRGAADMAKETIYLQAREYMERGRFAEAQTLLQKLGAYKDAASLLRQAYYETGCSYRKAGLFISALQAFEKAGGYADAAASAAAVKSALYDAASDALSGGDLDTAERFFAATAGYERTDACMELIKLLRRAQSGGVFTYGDYQTLIGFADTADLTPYLTSDTLIRFYLRGSWSDDNGHVFGMDDGGEISFNLPGEAADGYTLSGGVLSMGGAPAFRFICVDLNTVDVYAYENARTYRLTRHVR